MHPRNPRGALIAHEAEAIVDDLLRTLQERLHTEREVVRVDAALAQARLPRGDGEDAVGGDDHRRPSARRPQDPDPGDLAALPDHVVDGRARDQGRARPLRLRREPAIELGAKTVYPLYGVWSKLGLVLDVEGAARRHEGDGLLDDVPLERRRSQKSGKIRSSAGIR